MDTAEVMLKDGRWFYTAFMFYLRSRYHDYSSALTSVATDDWAKSVYDKSREAFQWLLTLCAMLSGIMMLLILRNKP